MEATHSAPSVLSSSLSIDQLWEILQDSNQDNVLSVLDFRSSLFRLLHLISHYATIKSDTKTTANIQKEHIAEKILQCLVKMLKINEELFFWEILPHLLSVLCLPKSLSSEEIRLLSLQCVDELLQKAQSYASVLSVETFQDPEFSKCIAFLTYKCFAKVHEEHPKGDIRITRASFNVLKSLLEIFKDPNIWYDILPSFVSELSAYLTQISNLVENKDAALPLAVSTSEAIYILCSAVALVLADKHLPNNYQSDRRQHKSIQTILETSREEKSRVEDSALRTEATGGTSEWFYFSIQKTVPLLKRCLPPLLQHPTSSVRFSLAEGVALLLKCCSSSLKELNQELVNITLALSVDEYPKVADACSKIKTAIRAEFAEKGRNHELYLSFEQLLRNRMENLPEEFKVSEKSGCTTVKVLTAAIDFLGSPIFSEMVHEDPCLQLSVYKSLLCVFEFDPAMIKTMFQAMHSGQSNHLLDEESDNWPGSRLPIGLIHITDKVTYSNTVALIQSIVSHLTSSGFSLLMNLCMDDLRKKINQSEDPPVLSISSILSLVSHLIYTGNKDLSKAQASMQFNQLQAIIIQVFELLEDSNIWSLDSHLKDKSCENAMLIHTLLNLVSACGITISTNLTTTGSKMTHLVLIHVLERLADPCLFVQSSAQSAVQTLCRYLGLQSLGDLILEFGDFVVDGVCKQLSNLEEFPMAPYLLASLFNQTSGLPKTILPLLSEPASHALQGLSIMGRTSRSHYSAPFLKSLVEMAKCSRQEAEEVLKSMNEMVRNQEQNKTDLTDDQIHDLSKYIRSLHSAAVLADGIAHLSAPLFSSSETQVCVLAFEACVEALHSVHDSTSACDLHKTLVSEYLPSDSLEGVKLLPEIPKLHRLIGVVWRPLIEALKDDRLPVIENSLQFLGEMSVLFGGRLTSRRFTEEAWPLLKNLLKHGIIPKTSKRVLPHGASFLLLSQNQSSREESINVKHRCQKGVLSCLSVIGKNPEARYCLTGRQIFSEVLEQILPLLETTGGAVLQSEVKEAVKGLACVDADWIWWTLMELQSKNLDFPDCLDSLISFVNKVEVSWHKKIIQILPDTALNTF